MLENVEEALANPPFAGNATLIDDGAVAFNTVVGNLLVVALHLWLMRGKYRAGARQPPVSVCCEA